MLISPKDNNFFNFRSELIMKLVKDKFEVILVCPYGCKMDYFINQGCRFIDIQVDRRGTNPINDMKLIYNYFKVIKMEQPKIVLTYTAKSSIYGGFVCRLLNIPYITNNAGIMNNEGWLGKLMPILYKIGFQKASCIMYQNNEEREYFNRLFDYKLYYRSIPGSGVNLDVFKLKPYPNNDVIIFNFVARIVSIKGINEFLECATRIKNKYPNTRFIIYGEYDDKRYEKKINDLAGKGIVEYGGIKIDMKPYIELAHAVIHPSYYEGMTNVVLEHSAMGRVCLGADIAGVREGIEDGLTGYLFEQKNVDSMIKAVEKFINLPYESKREMGLKARKKMETEFNRELVVNTYIEEIKRIVGSV